MEIFPRLPSKSHCGTKFGLNTWDSQYINRFNCACTVSMTAWTLRVPRDILGQGVTLHHHCRGVALPRCSGSWICTELLEWKIAQRPLLGCGAFWERICLTFRDPVVVLHGRKTEKMAARAAYVVSSNGMVVSTETASRERTNLWLGCQWCVCWYWIFDLDARVHVNPIKQPVQVSTMSPENISLGRALAIDGHLDHSSTIIENEQRCSLAGSVCTFGEHNLDPRLVAPHRCSLTFVASSRNYASCRVVLVVPKQQLQCPTSIDAGIPSWRRPVSKEMTSASATAVRYSSLFLTGQPNWNQRVASENYT